MRVFLRGVNEGLVIDHEMEVTVLEIQPDHVRLAITSPRETPSYREETLFIDGFGIDSDLELVETSAP
jgi:carbon storage regulator CsrA